MPHERLKHYFNKECISKVQYDTAFKIANTSKHSIDDILLACGFVTSKDVAKVRALVLNTSYVDLSKFSPTDDILALIPRAKVLEYTLLPLYINNSILFVAIDERADYKYKTYLERTTNMEVKFVISSRVEILKHIMTHSYFTKDDAIVKQIEVMKQHSKESVDIKSLVELLIEDAIEDGVSDIHISPEKDILNVFYRLDGVLKHYHSLPSEFQKMIVSRLKIMSNLNIAEKELPQDGQIEYSYHKMNYRLRVSTINTAYGENIVMRLLKNSAANLQLENLGLSTKNQKLLRKLFSQANGLILVTGPTGSGKTTTLYSLLKEIDSLAKNIITVEDPIEYQVPFIKQTQINTKAGYTFSTALRAFMRQDPDVMLVGEVRDEETAELALRASITGHLVLTTLHTNDAVGAIARLKDLGIPNYLVGSATLAILAQRLVRKLCNHCKVKVSNQEAQLKKHNVSQQVISEDNTIEIYEAKGCSQCGQTGYASREMILEILQVDKKVEDMITKDASSLEVLKYAKSNGMSSLLDNAHSKVLEGKTTFEEIQRVVLDKDFLE